MLKTGKERKHYKWRAKKVSPTFILIFNENISFKMQQNLYYKVCSCSTIKPETSWIVCMALTSIRPFTQIVYIWSSTVMLFFSATRRKICWHYATEIGTHHIAFFCDYFDVKKLQMNKTRKICNYVYYNKCIQLRTVQRHTYSHNICNRATGMMRI
jgi:hypothetical protein